VNFFAFWPIFLKDFYIWTPSEKNLKNGPLAQRHGFWCHVFPLGDYGLCVSKHDTKGHGAVLGVHFWNYFPRGLNVEILLRKGPNVKIVLLNTVAVGGTAGLLHNYSLDVIL
jgi:hypothetical protein